MNDPNEAWRLILRNITTVLDTMCPVRTFHIKNYRPDWMTKELIEQVKDRDYFYKKAKASGDKDAWNIAKHLRNVTNTNIRQAKREFILHELELHNDDPKKFWKVIHKVVPTNKSSQQRDILLKHEGSKIVKEKVAHFINEYFINVGNFKAPDSYSDSDNESLGEDLSGEEELPEQKLDSLREVREQEVLRLVKDINVSKSSGLDNVSSLVLKEAFKILITEITYKFNLSIRSSLFPDAWKQALVIPIPKTGNLSLVQNYRPISLLPLPGKILEKLVHHQLSNYLEMGSLLSPDQHGFRRGHSTTHAVAQLSSYVSKKLDNRMPTLVAYVDFKKAFDCVQHKVLLNKLTCLGIGEEIVNWVKNYLTDRRQRVYANNVHSLTQLITQGVPQGSVLGPLFYIIYANDVMRTVKNCEIALYADDTVLFTANPKFEDSVFKLQNDIKLLSSWCTRMALWHTQGKPK